MLRAYDKRTGQEVGEWHARSSDRIAHDLWWTASRYIIVAVGGANYTGEYLLRFAKPVV